ncbi:hypothetical protein [Streptomyces sp. S.PNR 29]|uniref:hypothetical protein n=1 Tax=Streptomyces sp. S.PNR 29 TaxID=2973805 RepID=UPI0025AF8CE8|nr:hypothetical protein [Streptomyces sp. S.PNR 29]MDN0198709.1 hypothetical protein [Streptomyces sp. S.PNR 29]
MRATTTPTVRLLITLALVTAGAGAVAGCGTEKGGERGREVRDAGPEGRSGDRARQVADAWDGSPAAEAWREGYYPMGEAVQLPEDAFRNEADKQAYASQNFALRGDLPVPERKEGQARWQDGGSLTLPLMGPREAYETLDRNSAEAPHLTVTGAELGEMTLATSRGPATVPAWLFTLEGYDTPLKRAALRPSKLPEAPIGPAAQAPSDALWNLDHLVAVAAGGRTVTVAAHHGSCDDGPAVDVLETDGSVVLSASVVGTEDGPCTAQLLSQEVDVKLDRPLGDRVLLDAFTGRPVPYGRPRAQSPS